MKRKASVLVWLPLLAFLSLLAMFVWPLISGHDPRQLQSVLVGQPMPAFDLPSLDSGASLTASGITGKVAVINFFASWCVSCKAEQKHLLTLARDSGVPIYGVAYKDDAEKTRAWVTQSGNPYRQVGLDVTGRTALDFGVYGVPETFVISADGRVVYRHAGPVTAADVQDIFLPLLRTAERQP